jgi:hypothetical protein
MFPHPSSPLFNLKSMVHPLSVPVQSLSLHVSSPQMSPFLLPSYYIVAKSIPFILQSIFPLF